MDISISSQDYMVTSINEGVLGFHDLPLWTKHGVINEGKYIKSFLLSLSCPYCKNNIPVSISPNIGEISVSVECPCCKNQVKSIVDSTVKQDRACDII